MLQELYLKNVILITECRMAFSRGFNAITGETGAGKTAIVKSLELIAGQKADAKIIRKGAAKAVVEAVFHWQDLIPPSFFEEIGIEIDKEDALIIRREVDLEKKNRIFLNSQPISLYALQKTTSFLLEIIGQHSQHQLFSSGFQRDAIDHFGELFSLRESLYSAYMQKNQLESTLRDIRNEKKDLERQNTYFLNQLQEIEEIRPQPKEDEILFEEYQKIIYVEELTAAAYQAYHCLYEAESNIIGQLLYLQKSLNKLIGKDPKLKTPEEHLSNALAELEEAALSLRSYQDTLHYSPCRKEEIDQRLSQIERLKKKYQLSLEEILANKKKIQKKLHEYDYVLEKEQALENDWQKQLELCNTLAHSLSEKRLEASLKFQKTLNENLQKLNMLDAEISIRHALTAMQESGIDRFQYFFKASRGGPEIPLAQYASGGEISRVYFAIKVLLTNSGLFKTIICDEIDANIGGETAAIIGGNLKDLAKKGRQVIAITHFPQVAVHADKHFKVAKISQGNTAEGQIIALKKEMQKKELQRMIGGEHIPLDQLL